jgi:hypothetical protein
MRFTGYYESMSQIYYADVEGMPPNTVDYVPIHEVTEFFRIREKDGLKCCSGVALFLAKIAAMTTIPVGMYNEANILMLYIISTPLLIIVFGGYLIQIIIGLSHINRLLSHMRDSTDLLPYAKKIKKVFVLYLIHVLIYMCLIVAYCVLISIEYTKQYFTPLTIAYVSIIFLHIVLLIVTEIYEHRVACRMGTMVINTVNKN